MVSFSIHIGLILAIVITTVHGKYPGLLKTICKKLGIKNNKACLSDIVDDIEALNVSMSCFMIWEVYAIHCEKVDCIELLLMISGVITEVFSQGKANGWV